MDDLIVIQIGNVVSQIGNLATIVTCLVIVTALSGLMLGIIAVNLSRIIDEIAKLNKENTNETL